MAKRSRKVIHPKNLKQAKQQIKELREALQEQRELSQQQQEIIEHLQREVAMFKRSLFGSRRERFTGALNDNDRQQFLFETVDIEPVSEASSEPDGSDNSGESDKDHQSDPDNDDPDPAPETPSSQAASKQTPRGRRIRVIPECARREKVVEPLPPGCVSEEDRAHGRCFEKKVGERITLQTEVVVIEQYVEVLAIDNDDQTATTVVEAKPPPRIITSFASDSLLATLAVHRYSDHLPYYRLEEVFHRSQLNIHRSTQTRWMGRLAEKLRPLTDLMRRRVLQCRVIQADETPVAKLEPALGATSKSYLWAVLGTSPHPYVTFSYTDNRSAAGPDEFFREFSGTLVADAYICYERLTKTTLGRINLASCLVHARRKFESIHDLGPTERTKTAMSFFQRLFDMEDQWLPRTSDERRTQRQLFARPLMDEFKQWLDVQNAKLRPKHPLRPAVNYMLNRWSHFTCFLTDGQVPTHNNASEQAVKLPVVGKKAWLFFGNSRGGETAAIFFTLIATCRKLHINPIAYLTDVFGRLPAMDVSNVAALETLLPDRWLQQNGHAVVPQRHSEAEQRAARKRKERLRRRRCVAAS